MSQQKTKRSIGRLERRIPSLSIRLKLFIGLGTLISGLLIVGGISTITNIDARQMVSRTLARQRELADRAASINNTMLNVQNQAFDFYDTWTLTGFERQVELGGFDYARETYLDPIRSSLNQIRADVDAINKLHPGPEIQSNLDKIVTSVDAYEATLVAMTNYMERLGYRDTGEFGELERIFDTIQNELDQTELDAPKATLFEMEQYAKGYFLRSELPYTRLVRESIQDMENQLAEMSDAELPSATRTQITDQLEDYYDHFLQAVSLHRQLQDSRANLVGKSDLTSTLVRGLYEEQQVEFTASADSLRLRQTRTTAIILALSVLVFFGGTAVAYVVVGKIIEPIRTLGQVASRLGKGELGVRATIKSHDEIGATARAFNMMADQLQGLLLQLEQRVAERTSDLETTAAELAARTAELEKAHQYQQLINQELAETVRQSQRRASLLQANVEVSRAITEIRDPVQGRGAGDLDQLLTEVTHLISQHFGFYHAGIFLVDDAQRHAVLRAANSPGGQRMLARQHKLAIGTTGIVGYVTGTGQPRIALDVGADAVYFDNPDMPDTRSEMAVPLRIGDNIVGALDVQSTEPSAFDDQDVRVLTALADQIAIAIQNANLFQQTQEALREAQHAQQSFIRQQWTRFTRDRSALTHEYTLSGVPPLGDAALPETQEALRTGQMIFADGDGTPGQNATRTALAVPIHVRGQTIGVLDLHETDDDRIWTPDEIALVQDIVDQLGQALEGARLFELTQATLAETQTLFDTSRDLAAAQRAEEVWRTIVQATRHHRPDACALFLFDTGEYQTARELILAAGWDEQEPPRLEYGARLPLTNFSLFDTDQPDTPIAIADVAQTKNLDPNAVAIVEDLGFSAIYLQPISVRGRRFGALTVLYETAHDFSKAETDYYRSLADQAALAFESQRLLAEAQRRAEREQMIRQITDKVRATSNLEKILETTVQELTRAMGLPRAFVRLNLGEERTQA